jgi:Ca2+-transporting ATPase
MKESEASEPDPNAMPQLPQDADTDPAPFIFRPYDLAHMLDPKNLNALVAVGGIAQLLRGLATDENHGVYTESHTRPSSPENQLQMEQSGPVPPIFVTSPEDDGAAKVEGRPVSPAGTDVSDGYPLYASLEERRRVYGANVLPHRTSKTLLQLMWAALKDKVLVRFHETVVLER